MEFSRCILRQDLFAAAFKFMINCVGQQSDFLVLDFRSLGTQHLLSGSDFRLYGLTLQSQYSVWCIPTLFNLSAQIVSSYPWISIKSLQLQLANAALKLNWIFLRVWQHGKDTGFPQRSVKHLFSGINRDMIWHDTVCITVFKVTDVVCM